jgi:5-formyltetrahydrofolate cyclo-ligase
MSDPVLEAAKSALRLDARRRRKRLQVEHPETDWRLADQAPALLTAIARPPGVVALYRALGSELDPLPLGEALARAGWRLALPAVETQAAPLVFRAWNPGERLVHDLAGLPAPLASSPAVIPSLILTPLLAFDPAGHRLGQGGGFYDRTFARLKTSPGPPALVGIAYRQQGVEAVPAGRLDQTLDGILTETGYIPARKDP